MKGEFTAKRIKFFVKDFVCKCVQIGSFLRIWSHLVKKSLIFYFLRTAWYLKHLFTRNVVKIVEVAGWHFL